MKPNYNKLLKCTTVLFVFIFATTSAQVGVGTTSPKAAMDVNSANTGFLMPRIALTASNVAAPVTNPAGGALEVGTMVFNTATAGTAPNNVTPGIYYWDGTKWVGNSAAAAVTPHRAHSTTYTQNTDLIVSASTSFTNIPNLNQTFTPPYTGKYQFVFNGYLMTGKDNGGNFMAHAEGVFKLSVNGTEKKRWAHSESLRGTASPTTYYFMLANETTIIITMDLTAGTPINVSASYKALADHNVISIPLNDSVTAVTGQRHAVGRILSPGAPSTSNVSSDYSNPCEINITFLGAN